VFCPHYCREHELIAGGGGGPRKTPRKGEKKKEGIGVKRGGCRGMECHKEGGRASDKKKKRTGRGGGT